MGTGETPVPPELCLAAPAGAPAVHALIATAVADHDGAAERATGSVSHVDHAGERVGRVDGTRPQVPGLRCQGTPGTRTSRVVQIADTFRGGPGLGSQVVEEHLLLSGQKAQVQPAEDVIHD